MQLGGGLEVILPQYLTQKRRIERRIPSKNLGVLRPGIESWHASIVQKAVSASKFQKKESFLSIEVSGASQFSIPLHKFMIIPGQPNEPTQGLEGSGLWPFKHG